MNCTRLHRLIEEIEMILREDDSERQTPDEDEKGGGKRKRRTSYSSGRREVAFGMRSSKISNLRGELKQALGVKQKNKGKSLGKKRVISKTPAASSHRWKKS